MTAAVHAPASARRTFPEAVVGLASAGIGVAVLVPAVTGLTNAGWRPLLTVLAAVLLTATAARRHAHRHHDVRLARLASIGLILKLAAVILYLAVVTGSYEGAADTLHLSGLAESLAAQLRVGVINLSRENLGGYAFHGTGFIILIIALLYVLMGTSHLAVSFVFALASFWGQYLFYRAFRVAYPAGDSRRYGWLVFLFPSAVFWTAAIGKDAWMVLFLGLCSLGAARILTSQAGGYRVLTVGLPGLLMVRPHVGAIFIAALTAGFLLRKRGAARRRPLGWLLGAALVAAMGVATLHTVERFFGGIEQGVDDVFEGTAQQSSLGGSKFQPVRVSSVWDLPGGAATVLFRPYPSEARNPTMLAASLEGVVLLGLVVVSLGRLQRLPVALLRQPHVRLSAVFVALFIVAFSYISNFGILARQRVQVLPFLFVLLAIPARQRAAARGRPAEPSWR